MKNLFFFIAVLFLAASCSPTDNGPVAPAEPIVLDTRSAEKIAADNDFAFRFFRETLATVPEVDKKNAFVSPLSLTMALGMLYNGTSPDAAAEMEAAMGMAGFTPEEVNAHYQALMGALLEADPRTNLAIANSIWSRDGFPVKPAFYDVNREYYDAEVQSRDFNLAATVDEINKWCADNTAGKIPKILDGSISPETVMYLINAVYFKGQWKYTFEKSDTRDEPFHLADGTQKTVPMMNQEVAMPAYWNPSLQCVDLPYGNGAFSMMLVMPLDENGSLDELIAEFDADTYNEVVSGLYKSNFDLKIPRWKQECDFGLNSAVKNLGIRQVFGEGSLSGISDDSTLRVSGIKQKTFVEVNEEGTEAAAVTSVEVMATVAEPSGPPSFIADRPFLYLIRERSTGAILFIGRMDEPQI
ncbi:MAG: serpin family protein [Alistipes sp.]|nr:serpin family protein [Alistipes sp.]